MKTTTLDDPQQRGAITFVEDEVGGITVVMLLVRREHRMRGVGSALLAQLCAIADAQRFIIRLSVVALDHGPTTLPYGLLREFYLRRGFEDTGNYSSHLVRHPKMVVNETEGEGDRHGRLLAKVQD